MKRRPIQQFIVLLLTMVLMVACSSNSPAMPAPTSTTPATPIPEPTDTVISPSPTNVSTPLPPPTTIATTLPTPTATPSIPNKHGVHLLLDDGRNAWGQELWREHINYARATVGKGGYVTELIRGDDLDVAYWQYFLDLCKEAELIPILRLSTTFDLANNWWVAPTADADGSYRTIAAEYANFIAALDWHTDQHYVIVGNEPNHGNEWSNQPNPAAYARFLLDVGSALHNADSQVVVLNAGLDLYSPHTGTIPAADGFYYIDADAFINGMYAAHPEAFDQIDVWSSHSYPLGPFVAPPWEQTFKIDVFTPSLLEGRTLPPENIPNRGVNGYKWELAKLEQLGIAPMPVLITETGWRHSESTSATALDRQDGLPSAEEVSIYVDLALYGNNGRYPDLPNMGWQPWADDPAVLGVTFFAFNGTPREWGHTNWLMLSDEGALLGTYPMALPPP